MHDDHQKAPRSNAPTMDRDFRKTLFTVLEVDMWYWLQVVSFLITDCGLNNNMFEICIPQFKIKVL